jgi:hypothetical protein
MQAPRNGDAGRAELARLLDRKLLVFFGAKIQLQHRERRFSRGLRRLCILIAEKHNSLFHPFTPMRTACAWPPSPITCNLPVGTPIHPAPRFHFEEDIVQAQIQFRNHQSDLSSIAQAFFLFSREFLSRSRVSALSHLLLQRFRLVG